MPDSLEPHHEDAPQFPEFPPEAVLSPRTILEVALYSITYYIEHEGDLAQLEQAQELIKRVLEGENEPSPLEKEFMVTSLTRLDLIKAGFPKPVVLSLSDKEMQQIANRMGHALNGQGYWEDLKNETEKTLKGKRERK